MTESYAGEGAVGCMMDTQDWEKPKPMRGHSHG